MTLCFDDKAEIVRQLYLCIKKNRNKDVVFGSTRRKIVEMQKNKVLLSTAKIKELRRRRTARLISIKRLIILCRGDLARCDLSDN